MGNTKLNSVSIEFSNCYGTFLMFHQITFLISTHRKKKNLHRKKGKKTIYDFLNIIYDVEKTI